MGLERNEGKEKEKEGERWAQMRRETKNERESMEEKERVMGFFLHSVSIPLFLQTQTIVPLWESWRSLPLLSIGRSRYIPWSCSQPIGSQGGRAPIQLVPKNVSAIDLFPGSPLLSSHSPIFLLFFPFFFSSSSPITGVCPVSLLSFSFVLLHPLFPTVVASFLFLLSWWCSW